MACGRGGKLSRQCDVGDVKRRPSAAFSFLAAPQTGVRAMFFPTVGDLGHPRWGVWPGESDIHQLRQRRRGFRAPSGRCLRGRWLDRLVGQTDTSGDGLCACHRGCGQRGPVRGRALVAAFDPVALGADGGCRRCRSQHRCHRCLKVVSIAADDLVPLFSGLHGYAVLAGGYET